MKPGRKRRPPMPSSALQDVCAEFGLSERQVRVWIKNYRAHTYDAAIAAGMSLPGAGGRPKQGKQGKRAQPTQMAQRARKQQRRAAASDAAVDESSGFGGIAAATRRRAQAGQRCAGVSPGDRRDGRGSRAG